MNRRPAWCAIVVNVSVLLIAPSMASSGLVVDDPPEVSSIGFDRGAVGDAPAGWFVPTAGWHAERIEEAGPSGAHAVRLSLPGASTAPFGNLMRSLPADGFQRRPVTVRANVKVIGNGRAQMWLRVDRVDGAVGAFDNMHDRPVLPGPWSEALIEAEIDADARFINIGFMAFDGATILIDDVRLAASGAPFVPQEPSPAGAITERGLENVMAATRLLALLRFFHPSDQCVGVDSWDHVAVALVEAAEPASDANELVARLTPLVASLAPTAQLWAGAPEDAPPPIERADAPFVKVWRHLGAGSVRQSVNLQSVYGSVVERFRTSVLPPAIDVTPVIATLGGGVSIRLPVAVGAGDDGTLPHGATPAEWASVADLPRLTVTNRATRLASVALLWGVMQHFYPYFDVVETDWDAVLVDSLAAAAEVDDATAHRDVVRSMVARLHDGHGSVSNVNAPPRTALPLAVEWAGRDLVVVATGPTIADTVNIGDAIVAVDGRSIEECHEALAALVSSASDGWCRGITASLIVHDLHTQDPARLTLRTPDGLIREVQVARAAEGVFVSRTVGRIDNGAEVAPGIVYFDLRGTDVEEFLAHLPALTAADALIFDLRGYPQSAAYRLLGHLIQRPAQSARWMIPIVRRPDRQDWNWNESGRWQLVPLEPRLTQPVAFLTDGGAISYAESIMGIVEHERLGEIVGAPTAGTNGNVHFFDLPGGDRVVWTGMKVVKHDGSRHHGVGIQPTVPIVPTQRGIADGIDEVLERAVEVLTERLAADGGN